MHRMDMQSREQYLKALLGRYLPSPKRGKGALLDEYCRNTGMARKSVLRKLAGLLKGDSRPRKKRRPEYGRPVRVALEMLWEIFDRPCGQRLKPLVEEELGRLRALGEIEVDEKTASQLQQVSPATIDRLLTAKKTTWIAPRHYGRTGVNLIAKKIPLKMTDWDLGQVGFLEMDLVLHCGATTAGEYAHSLSALEIGSAWWEGEAVMGRAQSRVFEAIKKIRARTPFAWRGIDSDNDNAFINDQLYRYTEKEGLAFTRSRPYRKNDNAYIEQKNFTHVRRPLGYLRYDTPEELGLINDLYRNELRLYKNFFQPVMRLECKERVDGKIRRRYAKPKTPYQILRESGQLTPEALKTLDDLYRSLNPADLKRRIDKKLNKLFTLYEKKRKGLVQVDPYTNPDPSSVTFLVRQ
jgi:hypothetical protein